MRHSRARPVPRRAAPADPVLQARIMRLSSGNVVRVTGYGPLFGAHPAARTTAPDSFAPVLDRRDRIAVRVLTAGWAVCFLWFWIWWWNPVHQVGWFGMAVTSVLVFYLAGLPAHFLVAVARLRRLDRSTPVPRVPVAFVVTRAPSEDWEVARTTLTAMLAQDFPGPYDVWLCDEDPGPDVRHWCREHHVRVSCRRDAPGYHRSSWPRRTRCKEGNLAYFYDHWGYGCYTVVAQLDVDHIPSPHYLTEMVRPFADPAIGYVAAPSVCDKDARHSWSARGRLHREAVFHGAVQLGHDDGFAPLCIGSHYAVRTRGLRDIGGLGPELAEDFSTTFLLNSAGWQGVFAIDAEAHGDGPVTFAAMVTQEFQWSRSLTTMIFDLVPRHLARMRPGLRMRFGFALSYYPLLALTTIAGLLLPAVAAVTGQPWVNVNYFAFLGHFWAMTAWLLAIMMLLRRRGLLRPATAPILSWESWLFGLSRWPFVACGVMAAAAGKIRPKTLDFKITPKSRPGLERLPLRLVAPYLVITLVLGSCALAGEQLGPAAGYVFLCIVGATAYALVTFAVAGLHITETAHAAGVARRKALGTIRGPALAGLAVLPPLVLAILIFPPYAAAVFGW
ncbi:glycosyltransferase [Yinghuangia aomiensis]|uniref:Glycosyltransferase n=1 Tax=Yinghuangia aomiensis TaxID=676205 RepID=A0ABP9I4W3_9ACTN